MYNIEKGFNPFAKRTMKLEEKKYGPSKGERNGLIFVFKSKFLE